jgi:hypothetical protein
MAPALIFAMSLPGLVVMLIVLAAVTRRRRPDVAAAGLDVFAAAILPGKQAELDQRHVSEQLRDDADDAAPPLVTVDLDRGTARIRSRD